MSRRRPAGRTPAPPEVEQDHVGIDVAQRYPLAVEAGKPEIDEPALGGIDAADALLDRVVALGLVRRQTTGQTAAWAGR